MLPSDSDGVWPDLILRLAVLTSNQLQSFPMSPRRCHDQRGSEIESPSLRVASVLLQRATAAAGLFQQAKASEPPRLEPLQYHDRDTALAQ